MCAQKTHLPGYIFNRGKRPEITNFFKKFFRQSTVNPLENIGEI